MAKTLFVSTRKGLFEVAKSRGAWKISASHFLGDNVSLMLHDPRDGTDYAALNLGHFGVKLHRRDRGKKKWTEISTPKYPEKPEGLDDKDGWGRDVKWATQMIWAWNPVALKKKT